MDQSGRAFHHSVHSESAIRLLFSKQPDYGRAYPQVLSKYSMHTMATQAAKRVLVVAGMPQDFKDAPDESEQVWETNPALALELHVYSQKKG